MQGQMDKNKRASGRNFFESKIQLKPWKEEFHKLQWQEATAVIFITSNIRRKIAGSD
jgi:hypothetical protein